MGDDGFWIDRVLMNETVLPPNEEFRGKDSLREELYPLVWNPYTEGFLPGETVKLIFDQLRETNYPDGDWKPLEKLLDTHLPKPGENDKRDMDKLLESFGSSIDDLLKDKALSDRNSLNDLLNQLQRWVDDALFRQRSDDQKLGNTLLLDFKQLVDHILPKATRENTICLKEQCKKLSKLTKRMFSKPTSDDTYLLNKLLKGIEDSIDFMLPKLASEEMQGPNRLLKKLKDSIDGILPRPRSSDASLPNNPSRTSEDSIDAQISISTPGQLGDTIKQLEDLIVRMLALLTSDLTKNLRKNFTDLNALVYRTLPEQPVFYLMIETNNKFARELRNRGLGFAEHFSYDVILRLTDLASGLGVTNRCNEFIQAAVEEKLGFHITLALERPRFRHWIVFNARLQYFEVVYGITAHELRKLINIDQDAPREGCKLARAHIINTISMRDPQGTDARPIDFHSFQGMFTPEFYPRRFALKDSIYAQRLDILAHLLVHVLDRYSMCHPRVTYCELSVGVGDITRPWVFDILCSFSTAPIQEAGEQNTTNSQLSFEQRTISSQNSKNKIRFRDLILKRHFPSLGDAVIKNKESQEQLKTTASQQELELRMPECTYKLLAGFNRQLVETSYFKTREEAINLLNEAPQIAIHLMLNEISKSARGEFVTEKNDMFYQHIEQLDKVKQSARNNNRFFHWLVGFDFFADEMGFPYCSFVARNFINYVLQIRKEFNSSFGLRIHCGENVPIADANAPAYRHFAAHMYIAFRCLRYLQHELEYGIRIGHGIAFQHILDRTMMNASAHRKSSVLMAEIEHHARHVFRTIAFEVNITSNEYLLGHAMRKGSHKQPPQSNVKRREIPQQPLQLNALLNIQAPIILATDNDGIWPILKCPCREPYHFSLSGECCRAISTEIINSLEDLQKMFENMNKFRFFRNDNMVIMPKADNSILPHDTRVFTVIIHPDIIKFIIERCIIREQRCGKFYEDFYKAYSSENITNENVQGTFNDKLTISIELCSRLAPIAFVSHCAENSQTNPKLTDEMETQYNDIFDTPPSVETVLEEWNSVYQQLIDPNIIDQSQCVSTKSRKNVFFSEGPLEVHKDKDQPMIDLIHYLQRHYHYYYPGKLHIHAFTRHINIKATVEEIKRQIKRPCLNNLRVSIFSTKDKEQYEDFDLSDKIELTINQTPLQRTNFKNEQQQNGLYAVCPHASAATAFLHMIGQELPMKGNTPLPIKESRIPLFDTTYQQNLNTTASISLEQTFDETQSSNTETNTPLPYPAHDSHDNSHLSTTDGRADPDNSE